MDELFAFIESLRNFNTKYLTNYCIRCRELLTSIEIYGAKKTTRNDSCSIQIDNIYIRVFNTGIVKNIKILINNKYMKFDAFGIGYLIIESPIDKVALYLDDVCGEYLYIDIGVSTMDVDPDIDWLLDRKLTKSARK